MDGKPPGFANTHQRSLSIDVYVFVLKEPGQHAIQPATEGLLGPIVQ